MSVQVYSQVKELIRSSTHVSLSEGDPSQEGSAAVVRRVRELWLEISVHAYPTMDSPTLRMHTVTNAV
jgi:hypothetical protein